MKDLLRPKRWWNRIWHLWDSLIPFCQGRRGVDGKRLFARDKPMFRRVQPDFERLETREVPTTVGMSGTTQRISETQTLLILMVGRNNNSQTVTVDYATSNGSATSGSDYTGVSGTLTFPQNGTLSLPVNITITNDSSAETDEDFTLTLSNPTNATLGTSSKIIIIEDDENAWSKGTITVVGDPIQAEVGHIKNIQIDLGQADVKNTIDLGVTTPVECGCGSVSTDVLDFPLKMTYYSKAVDARAIISGTMESGGTGPMVPTGIEIRLTWNGSAGSWEALSTSGARAGDDYGFALQVPSAVSSTGYYSYLLEMRATFSGGGTVTRPVASGSLPVVVPANDYGHGWSVDGLDKIVPVTGGLLYVYGTGDARFFSGSGTGTYTNPANEFGTLAKNVDNTYTYTAVDKTKRNFDSSGKLSSLQDIHNIRTTFSYNGSSQITGIHARRTGSRRSPTAAAIWPASPSPAAASSLSPATALPTTSPTSRRPDGSVLTFTYDGAAPSDERTRGRHHGDGHL